MIFNIKIIFGIAFAITFCACNVYADGIADLDLRENVRFFLYTQDTLDDPQQLYVDDQESITDSDYDVSKYTKFYTHGFNKSYLDDDSSAVKTAFLKAGDFNMIVIDWGNISQTFTYEEVSNNTVLIGTYVAKFVDLLVSLGNSAGNMALVGDGLGAHIVGSAGYLTNNTVGQVVGLDPVRIGFDTVDLDSRISTESAKIVEVIHTSNDSLVQQGHLDYYPNGGGVMLGCENSTVECSHDRAYMYYAEALTIAKNWFAIQCDSYEQFLLEDFAYRTIVSFPSSIVITNKDNGTYFTHTNSTSPYGLNLAGLLT